MGTLIAALALSTTLYQDGGTTAQKVAIYPWTFAENEKGTSKSAMESVENTIHTLFQNRGHMVVIPESACKEAWQEIGQQVVPRDVEDPDQMPDLPSPKTLLAFGKKVGADFVCTGRLKWRIRSVWVGLGPKTKADSTVDVDIVDVAKEELVLSQRSVVSNSNKVEKWYETAGALFITWGITLLSGGPKTPQMQRSGQVVATFATDPFFNTFAPKSTKIKGGGGTASFETGQGEGTGAANRS